MRKSKYDQLLQTLEDICEVKHDYFDDYYRVGKCIFVRTNCNNQEEGKNSFPDWAVKSIRLYIGKNDNGVEIARKIEK